MADKIISATLKVNTGTSASDIGKVNKELDNTSKELGTVNEESKQTTGSFSNLKEGLNKIPGPLGAVNSGVNTVNTSLKALAANPIVLVITLLVAALVAVYKAFASTEAGAEKLEQIFSGLGAVISVIRDRILQFANAIVSFFKGDFKEAAEQAKASVTGFADAAVKAYNQVANAVRDLQEAEDNRARVTNVNRAEFEKNFAKIKELISDENASYADRKKAIEDLRIAQSDLAKQELADAQKILVAKYQLAEADKNNGDKQTEYAEAKIAYLNAQTQAAQDERSLNKQNHQIEQQEQAQTDEARKQSAEARKQQLAEEKRLLEERNAALKAGAEAWMKYVNDGISFRQQQAEEQKKQDEQDQKARDEYLKETTDAEWAAVQKNIKTYNDAAKAEKKIDDNRKAAKVAFVDSMSNLLKTAADLFGKSTVAGKILAIAGTTIDTFRGAQAAFTGMVTAFPGPWGIAAGIAAAAAAVAAGIQNIKQITSVQVPGQAGGGSGGNISAPSITSPAAPIAPTQQGTTIDQDSINGIGNATSGRVYVLEQDITRDQDRNERLNRAARLGG